MKKLLLTLVLLIGCGVSHADELKLEDFKIISANIYDVRVAVDTVDITLRKSKNLSAVKQEVNKLDAAVNNLKNSIDSTTINIYDMEDTQWYYDAAKRTYWRVKNRRLETRLTSPVIVTSVPASRGSVLQSTGGFIRGC